MPSASDEIRVWMARHLSLVIMMLTWSIFALPYIDSHIMIVIIMITVIMIVIIICHDTYEMS